MVPLLHPFFVPLCPSSLPQFPCPLISPAARAAARAPAFFGGARFQIYTHKPGLCSLRRRRGVHRSAGARPLECALVKRRLRSSPSDRSAALGESRRPLLADRMHLLVARRGTPNLP